MMVMRSGSARLSTVASFVASLALAGACGGPRYDPAVWGYGWNQAGVTEWSARRDLALCENEAVRVLPYKEPQERPNEAPKDRHLFELARRIDVDNQRREYQDTCMRGKGYSYGRYQR